MIGSSETFIHFFQFFFFKIQYFLHIGMNILLLFFNQFNQFIDILGGFEHFSQDFIGFITCFSGGVSQYREGVAVNPRSIKI